jgi:transposase InsO family protein
MGLSGNEVASRLGVRDRTLRDWERRWSEQSLEPISRGRPPERVDRTLRWTILAVMGLVGPHVGLPTLAGLFPDVARSELIELQRRFRRMCKRGRQRFLVHALRWTRPGAVWAIDFSDPPTPIDGLYGKLLCIRDLASGYQLWALPCHEATAAVALGALRALCRWMPMPLVIKCDNGSAFVSAEMKAWAKEQGILLLYSPPATPAYNGSIEAGIGSIKTRAHIESVRNDRPGEWTCDDVEAAQAQANQTARPRGADGPTPASLWHGRIPLADADRQLFRETYAECYARERSARGMFPDFDLQHAEQASIDRVAITRALMKHGFLLVRRRRVSLPISSRKLARIS